jgi:hypothetical protein
MHAVLVRPRDEIEHLPESNDKRRLQLSSADKIILRAMLNSPGKINASELQALTSLPVTTLQRRRKRIEARFITSAYDVNLKAVGLMRVHLLITISGSSSIAKTAGYVINMPFVSKVSRVFGGTKHVLLVEAITSTIDIAGIVSILDAIRRVEDVTDVLWFTNVEEVAKNPDAISRHFGLEQ